MTKGPKQNETAKAIGEPGEWEHVSPPLVLGRELTIADHFDPVVGIELHETAFLRGMVDWLKDQAGWAKLIGIAGETIPSAERMKTVQAARHYGVRDPLCVQAVRLYRDFAFGRAVEPNTNESKYETALLDFWTAPHNRAVFSFGGVRQSSDDLVKDGEVFFVIFGTGPEARVRRLDPLQIERIITNPFDASEPWWALRHWTPAEEREETRVAYPMMYGPERPDESVLPEGYQTASDFHKLKLEDGGSPPEIRVYHVAVQVCGGRGNSLLMAAMPWAKAFRRFMESRLAIQQALARYAWKRKIKGTQQDVEREVAAAQSGFVGGDEETSPPPAYGSFRVENQGIDSTPINQATGAESASRDGTMIVATFGASVGMFPHYFGFEALSRMATAGAMELPMLRMLQAYQSLWAEVYLDLISYALVEAEERVTGRELFDIQMPAIVDRDAPKTIQAINQLGMAMPELLATDEVKSLALTLLGIRNPEEVLKVLEEIEEPPPAQRPPPPPEEAARKTEQALAEAFVNMTRFNKSMEVAERTASDGGNGKDEKGETA